MSLPHTPYQSKNTLRIVTAASLFDGHDAAINIMRRIIQGSGAEVIHLGHNRAAMEVVDCAIQEDAQAIAMTSYQGGHVEYFKYMYDLLQENMQGISKFLVAEVERYSLLKSKNCMNMVSIGFILPMMEDLSVCKA